MKIIGLFILLLVSFTLPGVIARVRARLAGRKGWEIYQHISNVDVLLKKSVVYSYTSSFITRIVPIIYLAISFMLLLFVPVGEFEAILGFNGDVVLFAYFMALSRFLLIIAAMDSGSSFQGMGSAREAFYGSLLEPALFIVAGTLALISGHTSFSTMFSTMGTVSMEITMVLVLIGYLMVKILNVELGRIPFDDTRTHLELTMVHEVMVLDYSGVDLAFINIASWFKMGALGMLAGNAVGSALGGGWHLSLIFSLATAVFVGFVESFTARNKMSKNNTYVLITTAISLVLFLIAYIVFQNIFV